MIIVSYDFSDDKRRSKFSNFLKKFGRRLQYSVFEIRNSKRVLDNIMSEIEHKYKPYFTNTDSVILYRMCESCKKKIKRYGNAVQEEQELVVFE